MNVIFFGAKRTFQSTLRVTRPWLTRLGLTAARFDLLTAVGRYPMFGPTQSRLRRHLGVSAPTVSRMLRSLEVLGLVVRSRLLHGDKRQRRVGLTGAGRILLRRATRIFITSGAVQLAVDCALARERSHDPDTCFQAMAEADWVLQRLREAFYDLADLYYAWHPDD